MSKKLYYIEIGLCALLALILLALLVFFCVSLYDVLSVEEVETYSIGCEISQMAYAEEAVSRSNSEPNYKMGVRNDDFSATIDISAEQFAKYTIGEIVEVEVTVSEHFDGRITYTYKLID
jgi:hypothetical protein